VAAGLDQAATFGELAIIWSGQAPQAATALAMAGTDIYEG